MATGGLLSNSAAITHILFTANRSTAFQPTIRVKGCCQRRVVNENEIVSHISCDITARSAGRGSVHQHDASKYLNCFRCQAPDNPRSQSVDNSAAHIPYRPYRGKGL